MQFKVPQFLDIEDKIFGPFTFNQFVYLAGGAGICFVLFKLLGFLLGAIPILAVAGFSLALTFYRPNNKPLVNMIESGIKYMLQDKLYIWKRREFKKSQIAANKKKTETLSQNNIKLTGSKLQDLAWSLDVLDLKKKKINKIMALQARATQEFIPIKEVRDGIIILNDGSLRGVILANSTNLSLKSSEEQKATIMQFQNFLNTLDFPVQISIQSRKLDIRPYLLLLENRMKVQNEPLLKLQTREYIGFIKNFTDSTDIMTKSFFIVVPYTHTAIIGDSGIFKGLFSKKNNQAKKIEAELDFEEKRSQLDQRVSVIEQGLARCGIKAVQLGTEEVVEVFYKVFNPGELEGKIEVES